MCKPIVCFLHVNLIGLSEKIHNGLSLVNINQRSKCLEQNFEYEKLRIYPHFKTACFYLAVCPKQGYEGEGYVWVTIEATKTAPSAPKSQACQTKGRMWGRRFMGCWYSDRSGGGIPRPPASRSHNNTALELYHPHHYSYHLYESQSNAKIIIMLHHEHHH